MNDGCLLAKRNEKLNYWFLLRATLMKTNDKDKNDCGDRSSVLFVG